MSAGEKFDRLVAIMARLRAPDGCPWDREQNFDTIKPFLLEETYEVMDAIDARDWQELSGELGDLLLQSVFFAQMAAEQDLFSIEDSIDAINTKLVRRHPHVFGEGEAKTSDDVKKRWDEIKAEEHEEQGRSRKRLLDGITHSQPALAEASQIAARAAGAGFDWENTEQVIDKLHEELRELQGARASGNASHLEDEIGDLLFVIVNLARFVKVDPEQALRRSNRKFRRRFGYVEQTLRDQGKSLEESSIDEMEALWQEAKRSE
ncbi:MAG: nucleoside triphosphate pyrophosphohydrolase [Acidobacteria bacterium]|nr:nucleoside triphosphate pyrophosphohydrolase [Acidobacteriota bacterium]